MVTAESGGGVDGLASRAGKATWAGELAPGAGSAAGKDLPFKVFGVEGEQENGAEDILHEARTGAMGHSTGPEAEGARTGVSAHGCKGAGGARGCLSDGV